MDWLNGLAGLLVGIIVGMTGVGGGSLMSPLLILLFGVAPATAIGTDLWFAAITKAVGGTVHHRQQNVDFGIVGLLAIGSIPAAILTGFVIWWRGAQTHGGASLATALGIVLVVTAAFTFFRAPLARRAMALSIRSHRAFPALKSLATILCGVILGTLVTLTSVGAGALGATFLLVLYPRRLSLSKLVGTDIAHAVPLALIGGLIHLMIGTVDFGLLAMLLIGSIPGIILGSRLSLIVPEAVVRPLLALILAFAGIKLLV
ncbi:sulfite exporter TauE/SafE family protein [Stakelama tenebrarum]|uniref:sulfite exporter TauE/SafE family protein n=1 Tax=Stakelama tenebrarum TaxID=2711215 RepID=UPI0019D30CCA|nr:sulfite exporter TauE/SafE family protein [Sphingosinithalassobacter tenebrarum]